MAKQIIAIDVDDVLANSTESLRLVVNKKYGVELQPADYKSAGDYHKYYERVWESHGLGEIVSKDELNVQMVVDQSHVPIHDKAYDVLMSLKERYRLVVLTARNDTWRSATEAWVTANFPDVFEGVIFGGNRHDPDQRTKGDLCAEIGAVWLIDDNPDHCQSALDKGVNAILFGEYGWHHTVPKHVQMKRAKNWTDVAELLNG